MPPNDHCGLLCPCAFYGLVIQPQMGLWLQLTVNGWQGHSLNEAVPPPPVDPPILVCGLKIWWLLGWNVKEDQASSAFWLCSLGFKVGQLMPGSSRAKWTSLAVVFGGVLEEPPGRWACQGNMKHLQCRQKKKKKKKLTWFGSLTIPLCGAERWNMFHLKI